MNADTARQLKNAVAWAQRRGLTFVRFNAKTGVSLDVDNMCPKAEAGNMCKYCYRKDLLRCGRLQDKVYYEDPFTPTTADHLREFCHKVLEAAPRLRSIRTFSLSDFRPEHGTFWRMVWRTIRKAGLRVHVITKQLRHVAYMAHHVDCVNVSIDSLEPETHHAAQELRRHYPNVIIRTVVLNEDDHWTVPQADLITVYHGMRIPDVETYRTTATTHKKLCADVQKAERTATCCITGHCDTCGKCWYPKKLRRK